MNDAPHRISKLSLALVVWICGMSAYYFIRESRQYPEYALIGLAFLWGIYLTVEAYRNPDRDKKH